MIIVHHLADSRSQRVLWQLEELGLEYEVRRYERDPQTMLKPIVNGIVKAANKSFIDPQLKTHADYWNSELGRDGWFAGPDFTAADIMMSFPLEAAATRMAVSRGRPNIGTFLERIHARPAYQAALKRGGTYAYA